MEKQLTQAVILAGGLGTRLLPLTKDIPKPMVKVVGKPFLEHLIDLLRDNGIYEVVLLLGYKADVIFDYFKDGTGFGVRIKYSVGDIEWDTGTRVRNANDLLDDVFLLMYADNYWPLRLNKLIQFYNAHNAKMLVTAYSNKKNVTKNNLFINDKGYAAFYDPTRKSPESNCVDIGFFIIDKTLLKYMPKDENFSISKNFLKDMIERKEVSGFLSDQRYYSIGSIDRIPVTEKFLEKKKVVFLDRDGVINEKAPKADYIKKWTDYKFLPGALAAIRKLTKAGFEIYTISNQAGIARGMFSEEDLNEINSNLVNRIEKEGGSIKDMYYCLHGWDDGCDCRKPKPGMFYQASEDYYINLAESVFIGDDERDIIAGNNAGTRNILVSKDRTLLEVSEKLIQDGIEYSELYYRIEDLYASVDKPIVVGLGGCSRVGKTTLTKKIVKDLKANNIPYIEFNLDNMLVGINERKKSDTVRERYRYDEIVKNVVKLIKGEQIIIPKYDPKTRIVNTKNKTKLKSDKGIILVDGVVALDIIPLREVYDLKVFVDTKDDIRLERLYDFYVNFKGIPKSNAKNIIEERELEEVPIIKRTRIFADLSISS